MSRVLVVDDEPQIRRALSINLRARGYDVDVAQDGERALDLVARKHPDVVVLDLGLPGIDGVEVIRGLRGWTKVPIVVLSVRDAEGDKVPRSTPAPTTTSRNRSGWTSSSPGSAPLFVERSLRKTRRSIDTEDFTIDLAAKKVRHDGDEVRLTPTEWHLVEVLVRNRGRLVAQRQLLQEVWGPQYHDETNYLRVFMAQVRRKLEPEPAHPRYFITEPGMGYRFEA